MCGVGHWRCGNVNPPKVLTPLQENFLRAFFEQPAAQDFFLTGGTALGAFYLHHRYSEDVDLFTLNDDALQALSNSLPAIADSLGGTVEERFRTISFKQAFVHVPGQPDLKVDLVRDVGPQFGEHQIIDQCILDAQLNIAVNKVTAIFGRAAGKDFVDLYFLLKQGFDFEELVRLAKEKDPGLTEFYLAGMLRQIRRVTKLPQMIAPITLEELQVFFEHLAEQTMLKLKPRE